MNSVDVPLAGFRSETDEERLAMALSRYVDDIDRGVAPSPDQLIADHPELGDRLRKHMGGLNWIQRAVHQMKGKESDLGAQNDFSECQLGDYRLVREIGRGGMGVVYEARQLSLGRTVALKLLPFSGLLNQKQIARFHNEAQAAAALHHPNIVPVFAVGCERGMHYYSMQFIDGQSLAAVIADLRGDSELKPVGDVSGQRQPARPVISPNDITWEVPSTIDFAAAPAKSTVQDISRPVTRMTGGTGTVPAAQTRNYVRSVVQLMIQAAEALQHAHECGVVHRDIKPSNLLLDRHGKLWITDFGLARSAVGADITVTGDIFGTMQYMSPEQAAGKTHLVDHRTDVYSLGLTLFETLTLQPVIDTTDRHDVLRRVQEEPLPSVRGLNSAVPFDLETIVMKAVAKSREDRYASAQELAEDLRRFLAGEPTQARRPTVADRIVKWVARHKAITAASFAAVAIALAGVSVTTGLLIIKQRETDAALTQVQKLHHELHQSVDRLGAGVSEDLREIDGAELVRADLLQDTLAYYLILLRYAQDNPALAEDAAKAAFKAGAVHEQLGDHEQATRYYRQSREAFMTLLETNPKSLELQSELALVLNNLGALQARLGENSLALVSLQDGADIQNRLLTAEPDDARYCREWALTQINMGMVLADLGRKDAAANCYRQVLNTLRTTHLDSKNEVHRLRRLATAMHNLSGLIAAEDISQAEELSRLAVKILRPLNGGASQAELGLALSQLGNLLSQQRRFSEAQAVFQEAISLQRDLAANAPHRISYQADLALTRNNFGHHWLQCGDLSSAETELTLAREKLEQLVKGYSNVPFYYAELATVFDNLGHVWEKSGKIPEAAEAFDNAVKMQTSACEQAPAVTRYRNLLEQHRTHLNRIRSMLGRHGELERSHQRGQESLGISRT